jgi:hypothetical protein
LAERRKSSVRFIHEVANMSVVIPSNTYGERTPLLQAIINQAQRISPFSALVTPDEGELTRYAQEYMARVPFGRGTVSSKWNVEIARGPTRVLADHWIGQGEEWRNEVGESIGEMYRRYSGALYADRIKPPIWPIPGTVNVFGPAFVANELTHRRCEAVSKSPHEAKVCWLATCFVEKLVDGALVAALFADENPSNPFTPLLSLCARNLVPIGGADGRFLLYAFDLPSP